jgi:ABC-type Fe3+/spermidine/putrescine transport system ATPase subunit
VAVLSIGRLPQYGKPEQVFSAPADREVAAFLGVETVIAGEVADSHQGQVMVNAHGMALEAVGEAETGYAVFLCLRPEDITIWLGSSSPQSSAPNRLAGQVRRIIPQVPLVRVVVDCGFPLTALITRASAFEMGLAENQPVTGQRSSPDYETALKSPKEQTRFRSLLARKRALSAASTRLSRSWD